MQHHPRLALVLAGSHQLDEMRRDYWDPLMGTAHMLTVSYLDKNAARDLVENPWEDFTLNYETPAAVDFLVKASGGHPYWLQALCSDVVNRVNQRRSRRGAQTLPIATLADAEAAVEVILEQDHFFSPVFDSLVTKNASAQEAQFVLKALAFHQAAPDTFVKMEDVNHSLGEYFEHEKLIHKAWEVLKRRDLLAENDGRYRVKVELFWRWLRRKQNR